MNDWHRFRRQRFSARARLQRRQRRISVFRVHHHRCVYRRVLCSLPFAQVSWLIVTSRCPSQCVGPYLFYVSPRVTGLSEKALVDAYVSVLLTFSPHLTLRLSPDKASSCFQNHRIRHPCASPSNTSPSCMFCSATNTAQRLCMGINGAIQVMKILPFSHNALLLSAMPDVTKRDELMELNTACVLVTYNIRQTFDTQHVTFCIPPQPRKTGPSVTFIAI